MKQTLGNIDPKDKRHIHHGIQNYNVVHQPREANVAVFVSFVHKDNYPFLMVTFHYYAQFLQRA